jgi:hypothetical protein
VKRCKHDDRVTKIVWRDSDGRIVTKKCDCGAWLSLGPANDDGCEVEIAAARLLAGWWTGDDTDDTLNDPIAKETIEHMIGYAESTQSLASFECKSIHDAATEDGNARLTDEFIDRTFAEAGSIVAEVRSPFAPGVKL